MRRDGKTEVPAQRSLFQVNKETGFRFYAGASVSGGQAAPPGAQEHGERNKRPTETAESLSLSRCGADRLQACLGMQAYAARRNPVAMVRSGRSFSIG